MTRWQPKMQPFNIVESDARPRLELCLNYEYPISKSAPSFETQLCITFKHSKTGSYGTKAGSFFLQLFFYLAYSILKLELSFSVLTY